MPTRTQTRKGRQIDELRRSTHELYSLLTHLGERFYLEAMALCDSEQEAAAWATANLVRSLEEQRLLSRIGQAP
jgi:hypothetical protein